MHATSKRNGFTLVELLVVIAIIGILVALLLPAVQAAREAARRMQCTNHLKQMALALHNYHDAHKTFPMNICTNLSDWQKQNSWLFGVLPFIEQKPLFDQYDVNVTCFTAPNLGVTQTPLNIFLCPSDTDVGNGRLDPANCPVASTVGPWFFYQNRAAMTCYKGCLGSNWSSAPFRRSDLNGRFASNFDGMEAGNGMFPRNVGKSPPVTTRFGDVADGTSNTFAIGEFLSGWNAWNAWNWYNSAGATCAPSAELPQDGC